MSVNEEENKVDNKIEEMEELEDEQISSQAEAVSVAEQIENL